MSHPQPFLLSSSVFGSTVSTVWLDIFLLVRQISVAPKILGDIVGNRVVCTDYSKYSGRYFPDIVLLATIFTSFS